MIDLDLLDTEAQRKLQTLIKQRRQNMLEAAATDLINQYFDAKTLEAEQGVLLGKYPPPMARSPHPIR